LTATANSSARVGTKDKKNLLVTLRLQLDAGLPLLKSLTQQAELSPDPSCQVACAAMGQSIALGSTLAEAALGCPGLFNRHEASVLADGEETGRLSMALKIIEDDLEWRTTLRSKMVNALIYPLVVVNVGYVCFNMQLLVIGEFFTFVVGWLVFNTGIFAVWVMSTKGREVGSIRGAIDTVLLTLPPLRWVVGNAILLHQKSLFFGSLSRGFGSGSSVAAAIVRAADQLGSPPVRRAFSKPAKHVTAGLGVAESFDKADYFSPTELSLISSGETSGKLDAVFGTMARTCRDDFDNWLHVFSRLFPLVIFFVVVAYVLTNIL
jgi:general secretion pathway protein F